MRFIRTKAVVAGLGLALSASPPAATPARDVEVADNAEFERGHHDGRARRARARSRRRQVRPARPRASRTSSDMPKGFDVEVAKILVAEPGHRRGRHRVEGDHLRQPRAVPRGRRGRLRRGVLLDHRRASQRSSARPAPTTRPASSCWLSDNEDTDLAEPRRPPGQEVCSVTGSTSLGQHQGDGGEAARLFDTYASASTKVLDGTGRRDDHRRHHPRRLRRENDGELKVVGDAVLRGDASASATGATTPAMCQWIVDTLTAANEDGLRWRRSRPRSGRSRASETPELPDADTCS